MIGDDVIDLGDAECRPGAQHPRFDARVFGASERALLDARDARGRQSLRWLLFAVKESALKALRRSDPALVFSPPRFEVQIEHEDSRRCAGFVVHANDRLHFAVRRSDSLLHAVAWRDDVSVADAFSGVARVGRTESPGAAARRFACARLASRLAASPQALAIDRDQRRPIVLHAGRPLDATLSLSHHGRLVSFACVASLAARLRCAA